MNSSLSLKEIRDLRIKFLVKLNELTGGNIRKSIKKSDIFDSITTAYDKDKVMPIIVQGMMEEGVIVPGDNDQEVRISVKSRIQRRTMPLLQILTESIAYSEKDSIDITVSTHGLIISGTLISLKEYYEGLNQQTKGSNLENVTNLLMDSLPKNVEEEDIFIEFIGIQYFCLKNPKFYPSSGQSMPGKGVYWMGKLDSVDGFFLGGWSDKRMNE